MEEARDVTEGVYHARVPEKPDPPELEAVLHSLDEHLRILGLILEELRVKLDEVLRAREPKQRDLFGTSPE